MSPSKPLASLSLDLDNKWSYMKTHGDAGWETLPSYLDLVVPRVLDILKRRNLTITFFVVGQDAMEERNHAALRSIADAGHEIGNHSFHHEPWLHLYSRTQLETELAESEDAIESATGVRPIGFRGPGFSLSSDVIDLLIRRGYLYDASTFPTFLGPLARAYYFMKSRLNDQQHQERKNLFGSLRDGLRPVDAYRWNSASGQLIEIPVTTMPLSRLPIHVSYLIYLSTFSPVLAFAYFRLALALCRFTRTEPSLLLHPLDFLGGDDEADLSFFPAMQVPSGTKLRFVERVLDMYCDSFEVVSMKRHAAHIADLRVPELGPEALLARRT
jgi:peptidoglycan/xylan/chitin deacetylase (PgdA/CDA1 family)